MYTVKINMATCHLPVYQCIPLSTMYIMYYTIDVKSTIYTYDIQCIIMHNIQYMYCIVHYSS